MDSDLGRRGARENSAGRRLVRRGASLAAVAALTVILIGASPARPLPGVEADIALVVSVDTSESVDDKRFGLQMNGIAAALEDAGVISTITSGPNGAIVLTLVVWADKSEIAIPWVKIASKADAFAVAERVRNLPRFGGEFTCLSRMFRHLSASVLPSLPVKASRVVVDVSGDGVDNCSLDETTTETRDELVNAGVTINGLPIIEDPERIVGAGAYRAPGSPIGNLRPLETRDQFTLEGWYTKYVMGGEHAFILPANGYEDFARAMRQKFVTEISLIGIPTRSRT